MADDQAKNIPTLDEVVEIGPAVEEEQIHIVADDDVDDIYDDDFDRLFEPATDEPGDAAGSDSGAREPDNLRSLGKRQAPAITADRDDDSGDLDDISINASQDSRQPDADDTGNEDMWLHDWQEDIIESAAIDEMDNDADIEITAQAIELEDAEAQPMPEQAAEPTVVRASRAAQDDGPGSDAEAGQAAKAGVSVTDALAEVDDIPRLVNDLVSRIMPEIEWKLRTRIREILEDKLERDD